MRGDISNYGMTEISDWFKAAIEEKGKENRAEMIELADLLDKALNRSNPKNRVLTLEEFFLRKIDSEDLDFSWIEFAKGTQTKLHHLNQFIVDDYNSEYETFDLFFYGSPNHWRFENESEYGKTWRCWLRKPTKEEMEGTPWEGDGHE